MTDADDIESELPDGEEPIAPSVAIINALLQEAAMARRTCRSGQVAAPGRPEGSAFLNPGHRPGGSPP